MSKTRFVGFGEEGFWAYDVALGILLKTLIDRACLRSGSKDGGWLSGCIEHWRLIAIVDPYGLELDGAFSEEQAVVFLALLDECCAVLGERASIPAQEVESWDILEGNRLFARGDPELPTAPIVELARAVQALLRGRLPPAPEGTTWLFGAPEGRTTIGMRRAGE